MQHRATLQNIAQMSKQSEYAICTLSVLTLFLVGKCLDEACGACSADITEKRHTKLSM